MTKDSDDDDDKKKKDGKSSSKEGGKKKRHDRPLLMDRKQAAKFLGLPKTTLSRLATKGEGPPFLKIGRKIYHLSGDLENWIRNS